MKRKLTYLSGILGTSLYMVFSHVAGAAAATQAACSGSSSSFLGFPTWYKYLNPTFENGNCVLHANFPDDMGKIGLALVEILLRLGGLVAVIFVVYGGFNYITSQGEPDKTKSARQMIVNSIIGLIITTVATVIVAFIGREFA